MRLALFSVIVIILASCGASKEINKTVFSTNLERNILLGKVNRQGLKSEVFVEYFHRYYADYKLDTVILNKINKASFKNLEIKLVMATWCGDSQREVPRFYKIIDFLKFPERKIQVISVDRSKKAKGFNLKSINIERVPTFIFYENNIETGRIIESPIESLEKDMLKILSRN